MSSIQPEGCNQEQYQPISLERLGQVEISPPNRGGARHQCLESTRGSFTIGYRPKLHIRHLACNITSITISHLPFSHVTSIIRITLPSHTNTQNPYQPHHLITLRYHNSTIQLSKGSTHLVHQHSSTMTILGLYNLDLLGIKYLRQPKAITISINHRVLCFKSLYSKSKAK